MYLLTDHGCYYTADFSGPAGGDPTWTLIDGGLPAITTYTWMETDPYRSGTRQYLLADNVLYVRTGGNWSSVTTGTALGLLVRSVWGGRATGVVTIDTMQTDINQDGYIGVFGHLWGQNLALGWAYYVHIFFYSTDYGATWHIQPYPPSPYVLCVSHAGLETMIGMSQIGDYAGASGYGGGQVLYTMLSRPPNLYNHLYRSVDKGLHWTMVSDNVFDFSYSAWTTDVYQDVLYCLQFGASRYLKRATANGATWTADLLDAGIAIGGTYKSVYRMHALFNSAGSYSSVLRVTDDNLDIWKSTNAGVAWTQYTHDAGANGLMHELGISLCHDSDGKIYGFSMASAADTDRAIWCSADEGVTWTAKAGANAGAAPYANSIPGHAKAICIRQVFN